MGDVNINGDDNTVVVGRRGGIGFFGFFLIVIVVAAFWKFIALFAAVAVVVLACLGLIGWAVYKGEEHREKLAASKRALAARADAEHHALLEGDIETGTYGQFPPAL